MSNRTLDRVLAPGYLDGLELLSLEGIRAMRTECQSLEDAASYLRRVVQVRIDIVGSELRRRVSGEPADLSSLIEQLPAILAAGTARQPNGRLLAAFTPSSQQERWAAHRIAEASSNHDLAGVDTLGDDDLFDLADRLGQLEREVSNERRRLHDLIDALQHEIVRRYKSGEATVEGLLR